MTNETNKQILALEAEIAKLKSSQPTPIDREAEAKWRNEMHQLSEARALRDAKSFFSRAELAAMQSAAPDDVCRDIVRDNRAPTSPSQAGVSGQVTRVNTNVGLPGSNTGWSTPVPIKNGLGQGR
jgi:hypothetical protein